MLKNILVIAVEGGNMAKLTLKDMHKNHRKRLRERYLREGIESLEDYRVLEMLLFQTIPVKDTYETAHLLINKFGSLFDVLVASYEELITVPGVGNKTALMLVLTGDLFKRTIFGFFSNDAFDVREQYSAFLSLYFVGRPVDTLIMAAFNRSKRLVFLKNYSEAKVSAEEIPEDLRRVALEYKGASALLAHNHPEKLQYPSPEDRRSTDLFKRMCDRFGVEMIDHFIISGFSCRGDLEEREINNALER